MNTDAVLAFVAVAEEGQFQRAADRLGLSQQAVSAYLRAMPGRAVARLSSTLAYLEPMQVIVGPRHPLAGAGSAPASELRRYRAWVPGIVPGSEWEAWYAELGEAFGVPVDATRYTTASDSVFDAVAASDSLVTFVGQGSRVALPTAPVLTRLPVVDPVPVYPWSLIWRAPPRHPGTRRLVAHTRRTFQPPGPAALWLPSGAAAPQPAEFQLSPGPPSGCRSAGCGARRAR